MSETDLATIDREYLNTPVTFAQAIADAKLSESDMTYVASEYTVLKDQQKDQLLSTPFFIRFFRAAHDEANDSDYVVVYAVDKADNMFIFTDGSTGIQRQLLAERSKRAAAGHPTPDQNILVANGLTKSSYYVNEKSGEIQRTPGAGFREANTYYLG